jgi:hypothetical protein
MVADPTLMTAGGIFVDAALMVVTISAAAEGTGCASGVAVAFTLALFLQLRLVAVNSRVELVLSYSQHVYLQYPHHQDN